MEDLISIIIPIYNLEIYLENCIDSIINQTYKNIEIILVDDCSTDGSINICRTYEKRDNRVKVVEKKQNEGAGMARNAGIEIAQGQCIMFIDGDDFVANNYVNEIYTMLIDSQADIAMCLGKPVFNIKRIESIEDEKLDNYEYMSPVQALENICYQRKITPGPWGKIFKSNLFEGLRFPNTGYEDLAIIYRLIDKAKLIAFCPVEKYYYLQRFNNTTLGKFNEKKLDRILVAKQMMEFLEIKYAELHTGAKVRFFISNIQTLNVLPFSLLNSEYGKEIKSNIKEYRKIVLKDNKSKMSTRFIALMSYTGGGTLKLLGKAYNWFHGYFKVNLK